MLLFKVITAAVIFSTAHLASAQVNFGTPTFSGSGCPYGSVGFALTPDQQAISVIYDKFQVNHQPGQPPRRFCTMVVPVDIQRGAQFSISSLDFRGYNYLPEKTMSMVMVRTAISGTRQARGDGILRKTFHGPTDDTFAWTANPREVSWSPCGGRVFLLISTSVTLGSANPRDPPISEIDSQEILGKQGLQMQIAQRRCM